MESVRRWVRQADVDDGVVDGQTSSEQNELVQLRRDKRRLEMEMLDSPESDPNVDARWMLGKSYSRLRRYGDAELAYNEVLEQLEADDWRVAFLHLGLGELHMKYHNLSRAAQGYAEATRVAPENRRDLVEHARARLTELGSLPDEPCRPE